ncbi:MAG: 1-acyl-sn-glycerol-3-phosphate acyltransferase [Bacteroidetes bacterium]|nr:1-acyl-sn-glycerol-3-phosphate acyltransferase [Bacteroidota bacterium]
MKILREIFGRLWATWGLVVFSSTMIVFLVPFFLFCYFRKDPEKTKIFIFISRIWMNVFLTLTGCPLKVTGKENFKRGETYVVVNNHNSFMDIPISCPFIPGGNKTIAKIELSKIPVFGLVYKTGSVLVDRKKENSRRESFTKMKEVLAMGLHMSIYPEGTRNTTEEPIKPFYDGAFRLAIDTKKKIIPALIFNTRQAMPADKTFFLLPKPLSMHFLAPVQPSPTDTVQSLKEKVFLIMRDYYVANRK